MPNESDAINPQALRVYRKRGRLTQQQLADAIHCAKDTVSRWERGKSRRVRSHLKDPLCRALRVSWDKLTESPDQSTGGDTIKVTVGRNVQTPLRLVAERYDVRARDVLELAPLLFLIVAERSLLERKRRLDEVEVVLEDADQRVREYVPHLGLVAGRYPTEEQLAEEEVSLSKRDVFGRTIKYEYGAGDGAGPFVHFVRDLTKDLPKDWVTDINPFGGDMIESYRIADDTLREHTGISEDEEHGRKLLRHIHRGSINLTDCLQIKRDRDEEGYRRWLSEQLSRAEQEDVEVLKSLFTNEPAIAAAGSER